MKFRSVDSVTAEHVGRRVTVRYRLDDGRSTDVTGILEHTDDGGVTVRDRNGEQRKIDRGDIVAARVIEPVPPPRNPQNPAPG